jgi:hypothetical protein
MAPISAGLFPCLRFKIFYGLKAQSLVVDVDFALAASLSMCLPHSLIPVAPAVHLVLTPCNVPTTLMSRKFTADLMTPMPFTPWLLVFEFAPLLQLRVNCVHLLPLPISSSRPC